MERESVDLIHVAQDSDEWTAEVDTVIKLRVPKTVEKLLAIRGNVTL